MIRPLPVFAALFAVLAPVHAQVAPPPVSVQDPSPGIQVPTPFEPATDFGSHSDCQTAVQLQAPSYRDGLAMEQQWVSSNYPHHFVFDRHDLACGQRKISATVLFSATDHAVIVYFDQSGYGKTAPSK